jgi:hypothetical protein
MKVTMRSEKVARCLITTVIALGLVASASAQTILLDLGRTGDFRSVTVPNPDSNGHFWNSVSSGAFFPNLIDLNGNPTGIAFGFHAPDGDGGHDSFNGPAGVTSDPPTAAEVAATDIDTVALGNLGVKEAAFDYYVSSKLEIQNLNPTKKYNLTLFGSHKFNTDNTTRYTVYTDGTYTVPVASADLLVGVNNLHNRDTVANITGVSPQASNIIYLGFLGTAGRSGYLNSMQITVVPEPGTLVLLASSAVGLVFRFRRR